MSPKLLKYVNIHSHNLSSTENSYTIVNHIIGYNNKFPEDQTISVGLHPWYINSFQKIKNDQLLQETANLSHVVAIGECGLDKLCATPWNLQVEAFKTQIILANNLNKPLIIHCVKAYNEVLILLKNENNKVPVIFHGFSKSKELAQSLLQKGYYLSFGKDLRYAKTQAVLRSVSLKQVFLETDHSNNNITEIYNWAQEALEIPLKNIQSQIWQNLNDIY